MADVVATFPGPKPTLLKDMGDGTWAPVFFAGNASAAASSSITLLPAASSATGSWVDITAGDWFWSVEGTFGGTTAQLEWRRLASTATIAISGAALTADGAWSNIPLAAGQVRVSLTGGAGISVASTLQRMS